MSRSILILAVAAILIVELVSCSDDNNPADSPNNPPTVPVLDTAGGTPADGAVDVPLSAFLQWTCSDLDKDSLLYAVCLGDTANPPVIKELYTSTRFEPDTLEYSKTYYWKIIAFDSHMASTSSRIWSFTTVDK
ncbi:MAG: hypothetical protein P1R58_10720 [bacterium]|nr:hypothetical protein [bacterium]